MSIPALMHELSRGYPDTYTSLRTVFDRRGYNDDMQMQLQITLLSASVKMDYKMFRYCVNRCRDDVSIQCVKKLARSFLREPERRIGNVEICKTCLRYCGALTSDDMADAIALLHRSGHHRVARMFRDRLLNMLLENVLLS